MTNNQQAIAGGSASAARACIAVSAGIRGTRIVIAPADDVRAVAATLGPITT